jgi:hypothetical protein
VTDPEGPAAMPPDSGWDSLDYLLWSVRFPPLLVVWLIGQLSISFNITIPPELFQQLGDAIVALICLVLMVLFFFVIGVIVLVMLVTITVAGFHTGWRMRTGTDFEGWSSLWPVRESE